MAFAGKDVLLVSLLVSTDALRQVNYCQIITQVRPSDLFTDIYSKDTEKDTSGEGYLLKKFPAIYKPQLHSHLQKTSYWSLL